MGSTVPTSKRERKTFYVFQKASELRLELCRYILFDFGKEELLKVGTQFANMEAEELLTHAKDIQTYITKANAIYISNLVEYEQRRLYMDKAIASAFALSRELNFIVDMYENRINVDKYARMDNTVSEVIALLKAWRKSENHFKNKLQ